MKKSALTAFICLFITLLFAQPTVDQLTSFLNWRSIGPGSFAGRIVDVEALENDFSTVYVASASGGVWKSENAGTTWNPIFDDYGSASIGDIKVFQKNPNIIWVGTGEANNRNSVAWGDGIYKSTNGGKTFEHLGLENTYQISRIVTHPDDPNTVYVGAIGYLWGYIGDRGLFKSTDGGKNWTKLTNGLPDDGKTGVQDLIMDPRNPKILYAAYYQRHRWPYKFESGGPNGGIYKSTDAGRTWKKLSNGLPGGSTGRIGLDIYRKNPKIIMAIVEHGFQPKPYEKEYNDLTKLGTGIYRSEDGGKSWKQVNRYNNRPFYYSQIRINPTDDQRVYVLSTSIQLSEDGGKTFTTGGINFEGGLDFHGMWIDPNDGDRYWLGKDKGLTLTHDHGKTFQLFDNMPIGQFYAMGVDMRDPYFVFGGTQDNGTWGGPSFSKDARGVTDDHWWKLHWGDGMFIQIDPSDWRQAYTEAENGSFRKYNMETREVDYSRPSARNIINLDQYYPQAKRTSDGAVGDANSEAQMRVMLAQYNQVLSEHIRFNWRSPMVMSKHNSKTLFLGGNHLFKTIDGGDHWEIVSPDLTTQDPAKYDRTSGGLTSDITGAETHCAITAFSESALNPSLLWVGTDDGNVQITRNGGVNWINVRANIPEVPAELWVSHVEASAHYRGTAYITFDGHRSANLSPWIFKTEDYGATWTRITNGIDEGQVMYVIREDHKNADLLFAGSEFTCFVSLDAGNSWSRMMNEMPTVAFHDMVIHPRDGDLVAATHGRAFWILDGIEPLQQFSAEVAEKDFHLFNSKPMTLWNDLSHGGVRGHFFFLTDNPPEIPFRENAVRSKLNSGGIFHYYVKSDLGKEVEWTISSFDGKLNRIIMSPGNPGIHRVQWDFRFDPSEESKKGFVKNGVDKLNQLLALPNISNDHKSKLQSLVRDLQSAESVEKMNEVSEKVTMMYQHERSMRQYRLGTLSGRTASIGDYILSCSMNGEEISQRLSIRPDPMEGW